MKFNEIDFNKLVKQNDKLKQKSLQIREKSNEVKKELLNIENILNKRVYKRSNFRKTIFFIMFIIMFLPFIYLMNDKNYFYCEKKITESNEILKYDLHHPLKKIKLFSKTLTKPKNIIIGGISIKIIQAFNFYNSHIKKLESIIRILINK